MQHQLALACKVAAAMLLGGIIGVEREIADKPAGFRTHMLIAGAAASVTGLSVFLVEQFKNLSLPIRSDPVVVIQAIFTGVSFLGAGTIIRSNKGEHVQGLTTASSILLVSAVGIATALSQWILAVAICGLALFALRAMRWVQFWIEDYRKRNEKIIVENKNPRT